MVMEVQVVQCSDEDSRSTAVPISVAGVLQEELV